MWKNRTYFTFKEVFETLGGAFSFLMPSGWESMLSAQYGNSNLLFANSHLKPHIQDVLDIVLQRFGGNYLGYTEDDSLSVSEAKRLLQPILNVILMTYDRYANIIDIYQSNVSKLMNQVKTTTSVKNTFNDTPQESGDFDDDMHLTNINNSQGETLMDSDTPMGRIREIQESLRSTLMDWSNEFDKCFIEEGNL